MKKLRAGVAGLGRIGWQFHIPELRKHEGFELAAVADPSAERLQEAETQFGVKGYSDYETMLREEQLDLVVIASPTLFHAEQTLAAFERGTDVFMEKPMAATLEEADRMIEAMRRHGRKLMVYQPHRTMVAYLAARSILERDLLGPVYMLKRAVSNYMRRNDWQAFAKYGGGMLNNYGAHFIDQLLSLAGAPAKRVSAQLRTIASLGDADDVVKAVIETENGIVLDIDINMATALPLPEWVLMGQRGTAVLERNEEGLAFRVRYFRPDELGELQVNEGLAAPGRTYSNHDQIPWREELVPLSGFTPVDFYDKLYGYYALQEPPFVPIEETREVMRIIAECRGQAQN